MTAVWLPPGKQTFVDINGDPLVAGKVWHYIPSTSTLKDTWQDEDQGSLNTNPVILDARGQAIIWGDGLYRQKLTDADDNLIWDQETGFLGGGGGGVTFATPAEVAALTDPTKVISPYALGASGVLGGGGGGVTLASLAEVAAGVNNTKAVSPYTLAQSGVLLFPTLKQFGGVPDGNPASPGSGTDNVAFFNAAIAQPYSRVWLQDGFYRTTNTLGQLQKYFDGPGRIIVSGEVFPGRFTYLATKPTQYPIQGPSGWFAGDTQYIQPEYFIIGANVRNTINERYFEATTIPHNRWFTAYSGNSGINCRLTAPANSGATSATVDSTAGFSNGQVIGFCNSSYAITDTVTISSLGPTTINFSPALANNHAITDAVTQGLRTNNPFEYVRGINHGQGDFYGDVVRVNQSYQPLAGQTHFFETSTVGQYGGDVAFTAGSSGCYATGGESRYQDNGEDVAVIGQVDTYLRTNAVGARYGVWLGLYQTSEGTRPADACFVMAGPWRIGFDTVRADLTSNISVGDNLNIAINTQLGHRWVMNSTAVTGGPGTRGGSPIYGPLYGNLPGDMYIESGNDGTSDFIAMRFNRSAPNDGRARLRPTAFQVNKAITSGETISASYQLATLGSNLFGNYPTVLFGFSGVWIEYNGVNLRATKNNGSSFVNIV